MHLLNLSSEPGSRLHHDNPPFRNIARCRRLVGKLHYLTTTRHYISFLVEQPSQFLSKLPWSRPLLQWDLLHWIYKVTLTLIWLVALIHADISTVAVSFWGIHWSLGALKSNPLLLVPAPKLNIVRLLQQLASFNDCITTLWFTNFMYQAVCSLLW